ncbi:MAG: FHA domain-containing protein [Bifidobacteriaceae bacterium]|jgi:S-DNA-T family DNA segregation ATPase FtsK/SpoIIIE|nr:FHA domain-containing protein [Bifidobacteriaceae bacterium]
MRQRFSYGRQGETPRNLAITADATATVGDVALKLSRSDPANQAGRVLSQPTLRVLDPHERAARVLNPSTPLHDAGVRAGAHLELEDAGGRFSQAGAGGAPAAAVLRVLAGPQAGQEFAVPAGPSYIGRAAGSDVQLTDPLVSGRHARLVVGSVIELTDLQSVNGLVVGGQQVPRLTLWPSDQVQLGQTVISVTPLQRDASTAAAVGQVIPFNRSPRVVTRLGERKIPTPKPPTRPQRTPFPWLAMVAPLIMGVVLYLFTRSMMSVVFVALSPLLMAGTYIQQKTDGMRLRKEQRKLFNDGVEIAREAITRSHAVERAIRASRSPSVGEAAQAVAQFDALLWTKRPEDPDFLAVRLGIGSSPSECFMELPSDNQTDRDSWETLQELHKECSELTNAAVIANLQECGSIGVAGALPAAGDVARGLVLQLVALHAPSELTMAALVSRTSRAGWEWLGWLPHTDSPHSPLGGVEHLADNQASATALVARLADLIDARVKAADSSANKDRPDPRGPVDRTRPDAPPPPRIPTVVALVADDAPADRARLTQLAEWGPDVGVHIIWLARRIDALPGSCRTFVSVENEDDAVRGVPYVSQVGGIGQARGAAGQVRLGLHTYPLACDGISQRDCETLARRLAPTIDAGAPVEDDSDLPRALSYLALAGNELAQSPELIVERWQQTFSINNRDPSVPKMRRKPGGLSALVGQSANGQFNLDLRLQGPHALVGGTTGSGKSEFLQAWVMGLASKYSPDRVNFLFVDYKGGAAFADCVQLPHCVGLVTDLSPHLVRRALTSLRAELSHREHLLNAKKAKDLVSLEREGDADTPPSLLIVVDEFAALVQEVPEFVDGVIDVAQRGRSLGLHLILATQRPAGVIRDNLRANTNLRIALRMADVDDSTDVLGDGMAAHFDQSIPGRAAAKTGPGRITQFQTGYVGGWTDATPEPARVDVEELDFGVATVWEDPDDGLAAQPAPDPGPNDIARVVWTIRAAFEQCGLPIPRRPWLDSLAAVYDLARLQGHRDDAHLLLGVMDDPKAQAQPVVYYEPDRDGNLAILGAGGAGKSTALRTIALSAALSTRHGGPCHVYALDFSSGGLRMLEVLPHVGAVISGDDEERVIRTLRMLKGVVDERVSRYAAVNAATITEYRAAAGQPDEPRIVLLIDGMGSFREEYEFTGRSAWFTTFAQIAADGRPLGVHVVMTGDRPAAIPPSIGATVQRRIVLRLAAEDDYLMLGAPKDILDASSPPGRGIIDGNEMQFAVLGADSNVAVQARTVEGVAQTARRRGSAQAPPIGRLPEQIALSELPLADERGWPVIGVADLDLAPLGVEPRGAMLLAGPPGSGRTTALASIATALAGLDGASGPRELVFIAPRRSALEGALSWSVTAIGEDASAALAEELIAKLASDTIPAGRFALMIEGITEFTGTGAEDPLDRLVRAAARAEQFVVGESESSTWSQAWALAKGFKAARRGLVLVPGDMDTDNLTGVSVGRIRTADFPPGRGFLIGGGRFAKLQVAVA